MEYYMCVLRIESIKYIYLYIYNLMSLAEGKLQQKQRKKKNIFFLESQTPNKNGMYYTLYITLYL